MDISAVRVEARRDTKEIFIDQGGGRACVVGAPDTYTTLCMLLDELGVEYETVNHLQAITLLTTDNKLRGKDF